MRLNVFSVVLAAAMLCNNLSYGAVVDVPSIVSLENVTTTVRGIGETIAEAISDANRQARAVSGGSYTNAGSSTRKVGSSYICDLKIVYRK